VDIAILIKQLQQQQAAGIDEVDAVGDDDGDDHDIISVRPYTLIGGGKNVQRAATHIVRRR
jgi:hypothetical protein